MIQALGGGAIMPTSMAMITEVFPREERGKALGFWGLGSILGPAIGPTLGGFLTHSLGWRSIFLVNLPVGIICVFLGLRMLAEDVPHRSTRRPFDLWGFLFLTAFLVAFLLGLSKGESEGWTSPFILSCAVISLLGFIGFILVETHVTDRVIDLALFKIPAFSSSMVMTAARSIVLFGGTFLLPIFVQNLHGLRRGHQRAHSSSQHASDDGADSLRGPHQRQNSAALPRAGRAHLPDGVALHVPQHRPQHQHHRHHHSHPFP